MRLLHRPDDTGLFNPKGGQRLWRTDTLLATKVDIRGSQHKCGQQGSESCVLVQLEAGQLHLVQFVLPRPQSSLVGGEVLRHGDPEPVLPSRLDARLVPQEARQPYEDGVPVA